MAGVVLVVGSAGLAGPTGLVRSVRTGEPGGSSGPAGCPGPLGSVGRGSSVGSACSIDPAGSNRSVVTARLSGAAETAGPAEPGGSARSAGRESSARPAESGGSAAARWAEATGTQAPVGLTTRARFAGRSGAAGGLNAMEWPNGTRRPDAAGSTAPIDSVEPRGSAGPVRRMGAMGPVQQVGSHGSAGPAGSAQRPGWAVSLGVVGRGGSAGPHRPASSAVLTAWPVPVPSVESVASEPGGLSSLAGFTPGVGAHPPARPGEVDPVSDRDARRTDSPRDPLGSTLLTVTPTSEIRPGAATGTPERAAFPPAPRNAAAQHRSVTRGWRTSRWPSAGRPTGLEADAGYELFLRVRTHRHPLLIRTRTVSSSRMMFPPPAPAWLGTW
jgi:hypothetical protein